jgi:hypothetical protein
MPSSKAKLMIKNSGCQQPRNVVIDGVIGAQALRTPKSKPILSKRKITCLKKLLI